MGLKIGIMNCNRVQRIFAFIALVFFSSFYGVNLTAQNTYPTNYKSELGFVENKGQVLDQDYKPNTDVKYLLSFNNGMNVQLRENGFSYDTYILEAKEEEEEENGTTYHFHRIDIELLNSNPNLEIIAENPSGDYLNFYNSLTSEKGITNVGSFQKVIYKGIYPNIDIEFYLDENQQFKYNFILHPGAEIEQIKLSYQGCKNLKLKKGNLKIGTSNGDFYENIPSSWLKENDEKISVVYKDLGGHIYGFESEKYSNTSTLIIDPVPVLVWGTYYGGTGIDDLRSVDIDAIGNIYAVGVTASLSFIATSGAFQTSMAGILDVFIVKFSSSGQRLWATYFGGSKGDWATDMTLTSFGDIMVGGYTKSIVAFATSLVHQNTYGGGDYDGFLAKFNSNGQRIWCSYYGGSGDDLGSSVVADTNGNAYLYGYTNSSSSIGTTGAYQSSKGGNDDAFLVKFDSSGQRQWGTYFGGMDNEQGTGSDIGNNGNVYITGCTKSSNAIATFGAHQSSIGGNLDAFVAKFNYLGQIQFGTYYGGSDYEIGHSINCDNSGNLWLTGITASTSNISTIGSFQDSLGGGTTDAFLVKFNSSCQRQWGTYLGGTGNEEGMAIGEDGFGNVLVLGFTSSTDSMVTAGALNSTYGGGSYDGFVEKFDGNGARIWGTYFGGTGEDKILDINYLDSLNVVVVGSTYSDANISTTGAYQLTRKGSTEGFIANIFDCTPYVKNYIVSTCDSYIFNNQVLYSSGFYTDTLSTIRGCDSILNLTLTINYSKYVETSILVCGDFIFKGHTYDSTGVLYDTSFTTKGCDSITKLSFEIHPLPNVMYSIDDSMHCLTGNYFNFTNYSTISKDSIINYYWHFTEDSVSTQTNVSYSFEEDGIFYPKLIAESNYGCLDSFSRKITIHPHPATGIVVNEDVQCLANNSFKFNNNSLITSGTYEISWYFDNRDTFNVDSFIYSYSTPDTFLIVAKTISNFGCEDSAFKSVVVVERPELVNHYFSSSLCEKENDQFFITSSGTKPLVYKWYLNGQLLIGKNDSFINIVSANYSDSGIYKCKVQNYCGKDSVTSTLINVNIKPEIQFDVDNSTLINPKLAWQRCLGGSNIEQGFDIAPSSDMGCVVVGYSNSNNGDLDTNYGGHDGWMVKLNRFGDVAWKKTFGDIGREELYTIEQTSDGGYIVGGRIDSLSYSLHSNFKGNFDILVMKIDKTGNIIWKKNLGGSSYETISDLKQTYDLGYVGIGYTTSNDKDVSGNHSSNVDDIWVFKLDQSGNLKWQKCLGGLSDDYGLRVVQDHDSNIVVLGITASNITGNHGLQDIYVAKLSKDGILQWQKCFGGTNNDKASDIQVTKDNHYVISGSFYGNIQFNVPSYGGYDVILFEINQNGNLIWAKSYGTSQDNNPVQTLTTASEKLSLMESNIDAASSSTKKGLIDFWLANFTDNNDLSWEISLGGSSNEFAEALCQTTDHAIVLTGQTVSNDKDVDGYHGSGDIWVVKIQGDRKFKLCEFDSLVVNLLATGSEPIQYQWYKNNSPILGATSKDFIIPQVSLTDSGTYYCVATNVCGKDTIGDVFVSVGKNPIANFSVSQKEQCFDGNYFEFNDSSFINNSDSIYRIWDFGDNNFDTSKVTSHSYSNFGDYPVKLTVYSHYGCVDSMTKKAFVKPSPQVNFDLNNYNQCLNTNMFVFSNTTVFPNDSLIYLWDFGDFSNATIKNPNHSYNTFDTFNVVLIGASYYGCIDTVSKQVITFPFPNAKFSFNDSGQCLTGNNYSFANFSTFDYGKLDFVWDFGDNDTAMVENPSHTYSFYDTFQIILYAYTDQGCYDSMIKSTVVWPMPSADFNIDDTDQCLNGNSFYFSNTSVLPQYNNMSYYWDFGDNTSSTLENPTHFYTQDDTVLVTLIAVSDQKCYDTSTKSAIIHPSPDASFFIWDTAQCFENNAFGFVNTSSITFGNIYYNWNFDDGTYSIVESPVHSFSYIDTFRVSLIATSDIGCVDSAHKYVYLNMHPEPIADFNILDSAQCLSDNLFDFVNQSSINNGTFTQTWYFGDGDTSKSFNTSHSYQNYDTLKVRLLVVSDWFCKDSIEKTIIIFPLPEPDFLSDTTSLCLSNNSFKFSDQTSIPYGSYNLLWDFGDNDTSTLKNPLHSYASFDSFNVKLVAVSDQGCSDSISKKLATHAMPKADFEILDSSQCLFGNVFEFKNLSSIAQTGSLNYSWNFGDFQNSNDTDASHSYKDDDTFYVKLKAVSEFGCEDSITKLLYVRPMPVADFSINDTSQCLTDNSFKFAASSTVLYGTLTYHWEFGTNQPDSVKNNINWESIAINPDFSYPFYDTFLVKQVSASNFNCKDSVLKTIYVQPMPIADFTILDSSQCLVGNKFMFSNQSTIDQINSISYHWDFGDLQNSVLENPSHTFSSDDHFNVQLIANSSFGCADTISKSIIVHPMPVADFNINDSDQCLKGNLFRFTNLSTISSSDNLSFIWDFDNDETSTLENPEKSYLIDKVYNVKLLVSSSQSCMDSVEKSLVVRPMPVSDFSVNDSSQCLSGNQFEFINHSIIEAGYTLTYLWDFGDGNKDIIENPIYSYANDTTFKVMLVSTSDLYFCKDTIYKNMVIHPMPEVNFGFEQPCLDDTIDFNDKSNIKNPYKNIKWNWEFGAGDFASGQNAQHIYTTGGIHQVKLIVTSDYNCSDSAIKSLYFYEKLDAPILDRVTVIDDDILIEWDPVSIGNPKNYMLEKSIDDEHYTLINNFDNNTFDFIDQNVDVNSKSYYYRLKSIDSCYDHGPYSNIGKSIFLQINEMGNYPDLFWNSYQYWQSGVAGYDVNLLANNKKSYDLLSTIVDTAYSDMETSINQAEYCYFVEAIRAGDGQTSRSNYVCAETPFNMYVPNAFTPNDDGNNDLFEVKGTHIISFDMKIFNRWGELLFETDDIHKGWDGKFNGSDCPTGVYVVQIFARGTLTQRESYNGNITLIR